MEHMYSFELLDEMKNGKKEFDGIFLEFAELNDKDFSGLVIRNSKINYAQFRFSNLNGAKFINCEMFFVSFFGSNLENTVFEKCKIDMARFDTANAKNTRMQNCALSYCLIFNIVGEIDFHGTSEFKTIRNLQTFTEEDIINALKIVGNRIEDLPLEIRSELNRRISSVLIEFERDQKLTQTASKSNAYEPKPDNARVIDLYKAMSKIGEDIIKYGNSEVYKNRKPYGK